ncbi:MAG: hypothetical protein ACQESF_02485 [Nanobdellota archaeon]
MNEDLDKKIKEHCKAKAMEKREAHSKSQEKKTLEKNLGYEKGLEKNLENNYGENSPILDENNYPEILQNQDSQLEELYDVNRPMNTGPSGGLETLPELVSAINKNQKKFEKLRKINESDLYRGLTSVVDGVWRVIGKNKPRKGIYDLFLEQKENVSEMNYILLDVVRSYKPRHQKREKELNRSIDRAIKNYNELESLENSIPDVVKDHKAKLEKLSQYNKNENPNEYYTALKNEIEAEQNKSYVRTRHNVSQYMKKQLDQDIEMKRTLNALFRNMIDSVQETQIKADVYQKRLGEYAEVWRDGVSLSSGLNQLNKGVEILQSYHKQMIQSFYKAVDSIQRINNSDPNMILDREQKSIESLLRQSNKERYNNAIETK